MYRNELENLLFCFHSINILKSNQYEDIHVRTESYLKMCFDEVRNSFYLNNSKVKRDENEETLSILYETDMMKEHLKP